jgi:hypothetical protein
MLRLRQISLHRIYWLNRTEGNEAETESELTSKIIKEKSKITKLVQYQTINVVTEQRRMSKSHIQWQYLVVVQKTKFFTTGGHGFESTNVICC